MGSRWGCPGPTSHSCHRPRGFHLPVEGDRLARRTRGRVLAPPLMGRCVPGGSPASTEFCVGCARLWVADGETWCVAHEDGGCHVLSLTAVSPRSSGLACSPALPPASLVSHTTLTLLPRPLCEPWACTPTACGVSHTGMGQGHCTRDPVTLPCVRCLFCGFLQPLPWLSFPRPSLPPVCPHGCHSDLSKPGHCHFPA